MAKIILVTGNPGKLKELETLIPDGLNIETRKIDIDEIQSLDLDEIVRKKLEQAYRIVKTPVIVEDVSAELEELGGLPGPFFKFFYQKLGPTALLRLAGKPGTKVTIRCTAGYYDGQQFVLSQGTVDATVVEPRGSNGFGFDQVVLPVGSTKTYAEMELEEKNAISHRRLAFQKLFEQLK